MTITQTLKNLSVNGNIPLEVAMKVAQQFDEHRATTRDLLKECERNVGMYLGEKINEHLASMEGIRFNPVDYHYEKPVGEQ